MTFEEYCEFRDTLENDYILAVESFNIKDINTILNLANTVAKLEQYNVKFYNKLNNKEITYLDLIKKLFYTVSIKTKSKINFEVPAHTIYLDFNHFKDFINTCIKYNNIGV